MARSGSSTASACVEHPQRLGRRVRGERQERLADVAALDAEVREAELRLLVVAAALHVLHPGQHPLEQAVGERVVAAQRGVEHGDVLAGQDVRGAGEPAAHAPREVVDGLVVRAAHDLDAALVAAAQREEAREVAARLLDRDDLGEVGDLVERVEADLDAGARRVVVEDDRQPDARRDRRRSARASSCCVGSDVCGADSRSAS